MGFAKKVSEKIRKPFFVMLETTGYMPTVMVLRIRNIVNFKNKMMIFHGSVCDVRSVRMQNSFPLA